MNTKPCSLRRLGVAAMGAIMAVAMFTGMPYAQAAEYELHADSDVIGEIIVHTAKHEDTFARLAREYNVGREELRRANPGVDEWLPGEGTQIIIPSQYVLPNAPRRGVVINIAEYRLYYFPDGDSGRVYSYPIGIARLNRSTPLGLTTVTRKAKDPTWYPTESVRAEQAAIGRPLATVVPPGPDNPLGSRALYLGFPLYLIHGTNEPFGIGTRATAGCFRMFPADVEELYDMVGIGTQVRIVNQPFKLGWTEEGLYLEAHMPLEEERDTGQWTATELTRLFVSVTSEENAREVRVDWYEAERVMEGGRGIPQFVSHPLAMAREREPDPSLADSEARSF
jgi:L,D-transpeptidase ErfK/SrfK